jgi:nitrogen fixation/metabolism regulation signal transduction histidine kinase
MTPRALSVAIVAATLFIAGAATAQTPTENRERARAMAEDIEQLMIDLEERAAGFPDVLAALAEGRASIEKADETVSQLIDQLTAVTDAMEDGSEFDQAIDAYKDTTIDLIAEAEASGNDAIRAVLPDLRQTLDGLNADDRSRAQTVIEARNVIAELEDNREAIAFFVKAGEVQRAAELISANVDEFGTIVERGKRVANGLIRAANP